MTTFVFSHVQNGTELFSPEIKKREFISEKIGFKLQESNSLSAKTAQTEENKTESQRERR